MTSSEFVIWLRGFTEACSYTTLTSNQWDRIKEELERVSDSKGVSLGASGTGVLNLSGTTNFTSLPSGTNISYTTKQQLND